MKKYTEYKKLKWEETKKRFILDFADVPITILALISSIAISVCIYAYLFFEVIYILTIDEFILLFGKPTILLMVFATISMIPILVFAFVVSAIAWTIQHYKKRKELEQELKENE